MISNFMALLFLAKICKITIVQKFEVYEPCLILFHDVQKVFPEGYLSVYMTYPLSHKKKFTLRLILCD